MYESILRSLNKVETLKLAKAIYHPDNEPAPRVFENIASLSARGENVWLTCEYDLVIHERTNMEFMVASIVNDFIVNRGGREDYDLDRGVDFLTDTNNLSTGAEEVQARLKKAAASLDSDPLPKPANADHIGVVKHSRGGGRCLSSSSSSHLISYPRKCRATISTDPEENFTEAAGYAVAAVITQLYSYMLQAGIECGFVSTGDVQLFLHASSFTRRNQQWRRKAEAKALKWVVNDEKVLAQRNAIEYKAETPPSEYKHPGRPTSPRQTLVDRSRGSCKDDAAETQQDPEPLSDDQLTDTESPSARPRHRRSRTGGVLQRSRPDPECPNRALHQSTKRLRHMIDGPTLCTLLRNQLDSGMDYNFTPLDIQDLRHEGRIYQQLRTLQGTCIPVCLGNIDCIYPYDLDIDVEIIHFLLLSWRGVALEWGEHVARTKEVNELENKLTALGVKHKDERCLNVLRNEQGQLMLIDFEWATLSQAGTARQAGQEKKGAELPLAEVSGNLPMKRSWEVDATGDVTRLG
ncbi:hypothetical protein BDR22DRAFT_962952 [Usnea florida]